LDNFPCTQCGLCCKHVNSRPPNLDPLTEFLLSKFPYKEKEDGSCEMLSEDNLCLVYDDRPLICNISLMAKVKGQDLNDYYQQSALSCNELITNAGLDHKYFVYLE